ncbi:hypothetical protein QR685DRAFT_239307 [Neurospora intermedia]|uniref:Uncharacterized protein n=1 Tax=Neurospora intermedia TaxID=5142 RepID=A0ABR3DIT5_NEUIN
MGIVMPNGLWLSILGRVFWMLDGFVPAASPCCSWDNRSLLQLHTQGTHIHPEMQRRVAQGHCASDNMASMLSYMPDIYTIAIPKTEVGRLVTSDHTWYYKGRQSVQRCMYVRRLPDIMGDLRDQTPVTVTRST